MRYRRSAVGFAGFTAACMLALGAALCAATPSPADPLPWSGGVQRACFPPAALAAVAGEELPLKHDQRFNGPSPVMTLQPFTAVAAAMPGAIRRVDLPKGRKLIALTFDLCEQPGEVAGYDGAIIDYLRREQVKATLFVGGKWMRSHQARTEQLMSDPLFEIANHSDTHRNLRTISAAEALDEINGPQRTYEAARKRLAATQCAARAPGDVAAMPKRISLFRFPYGACNPETLAAVSAAGLTAIQWDVSTGDPAPGQTAAGIADAMTRRARAGSIIINHANGRGWHTREALPIAIPKLRAMGFEFVTVSELLAAGNPVIAAECYNDKPGDTNRYDFLSAHALAAPTSRPAAMRPPASSATHSGSSGE